jgi:Cys-rich protein (TIGR01571 family)
LIVPFNPNASNGTPNAWKDGLLACTRYGIFHPSFLCAWCCPLILLGQVMTRLKMDWSGHVSRKPDEWKKTFRTLLLIGIFKYLIFEDPDHPLHAAFMILYMLYLTFLLIRVRKYIRNRDGISEDYGCGKYEDCCIAYFLPCCTVSQLARQTANYDIEIGYYMTQDGLAPSSSDEDVVDVDSQQDESMII